VRGPSLFQAQREDEIRALKAKNRELSKMSKHHGASGMKKTISRVETKCSQLRSTLEEGKACLGNDAVSAPTPTPTPKLKPVVIGALAAVLTACRPWAYAAVPNALWSCRGQLLTTPPPPPHGAVLPPTLQNKQTGSAKARRRELKKQVKAALEEVSKLRTDTELLANTLAAKS